LREQMGFCFGRSKSAKRRLGRVFNAKVRPFYAMTLRMAIMRASL
jgi:hypothetical protein